MARVIVVNAPGPKGDKGDRGEPGASGSISGFDSSSFLTTSSFYQFTSSYYVDSASFDSRINNLSPGGDVSGYTTTASFNAFTSSYKIDSSSFQQSIVNLTNATSSYINSSQTASFIKDNQTSSLSVLSASFSQTASFIDPLFISSSAAAAGFGSGGGVIETVGFRVYTDDTSITAGLKGYRHIGFDSNIVKTRSVANTNGNIDVNVKRSGVTLGTISLSNQSSSLDTTLTGWTTQLSTNDLLEFHISQSSVFITDISIFIDIQST